MKPAQLKLSALSLLGFLAPLWWTWAVSQLAYAAYLAAGSPPRPTQFVLWASIYAPAFIVGLLTGAIVAFLGAPAPMKGWLVFFGSLVLSGVALALYWGEPVDYLAALFSSLGNWLFFVASVVLPAIAHVRRRAV
jgi:hypothetical protein